MILENLENWFLITLALVWIIVAVIQDLRKREIANWWNFSLIAIALAYRAFLSVLYWDYRYFVFGLAGFGIFFALANVFYYSRVFAGGDAKLLMALGAVLPFSSLIFENLLIFFYFIVFLLFSGSVYGLLFSFVLASRNRKKFSQEFLRQFEKNKKLFAIFICIVIISLIFVFLIKEYLLFYVSLLFLLSPFLYVYAKSIEESCMVRAIKPRDLTEGDWLYQDVKVGKKKIKASWEGLSSKELKILKKRATRKILIKQGIPFTPAFFFAFFLLLWKFWF